MSKKLTPLQRLDNIYSYLDGWEKRWTKDDYESLETTLKEVSEEDRAFLRHIKNGKLHPLTTKCYQDLLKKQRAFDIIKNKSIDVHSFMLGMNINTYETFIKSGIKYGWFRDEPTKEEYDLLKEILK